MGLGCIYQLMAQIPQLRRREITKLNLAISKQTSIQSGRSSQETLPLLLRQPIDMYNKWLLKIH